MKKKDTLKNIHNYLKGLNDLNPKIDKKNDISKID